MPWRTDSGLSLSLSLPVSFPTLSYVQSTRTACNRLFQQQQGVETPPLGLAEAFITVGARTVVQKIWYDEETSLVDTVRWFW